MATAADHLSAGTKIQWLSELDPEYKPTRNFRRTSIICTIGPKTNSVEAINKLRTAGLNVVRMNFSHGSYEYHQCVKSYKILVEGDADYGILGPSLTMPARLRRFNMAAKLLLPWIPKVLRSELVIPLVMRISPLLPELRSILQLMRSTLLAAIPRTCKLSTSSWHNLVT